jgi:sugar phosphate isomerase/epimerase
MRVGLLIDPIDPDLSYEDNLKKASELGIRVVQLWYRDIHSHIEGKARDVLQLLGDLELELKSLAAYTDILDPKRGWDEVFDELKRAIDFAAEARIRWVVTESGGVPGKLNEWDALIDRFSQLLNYAGSCGVVVLVENGPGVLVNNAKLMLKFMKELNSDWVGINFDPANLNLVPDDVLGAVETLGGYIRDTHAKDSILLTQKIRYCSLKSPVEWYLTSTYSSYRKVRSSYTCPMG